MQDRRGIDVRVAIFALLSIALGGWAVTALRPLDDGTLARIGPGMAPRAAAVTLIAVAVVVLVRSMTGFANPPARALWLPWRLILAVALATVMFIEDIIALLPDEPTVAGLAAAVNDLRLRAGPADLLAWTLLRWTLAIAIGVVASGEGILTGTVSLLAGALLGLAGTDVSSGVDRLPQVDTFLERLADWAMIANGPYIVLLGVVAVALLCRINPLPAMFAYLSAATAEEGFRRALLLSQGDPLAAVASRPIALWLLAAATVIVLLLAWYRWPWRGGRGRPGRS
jgi:TctA family transporter